MIRIRIHWKKNATARDMSEVIRTCREKGWPLHPVGLPYGGGFVIRVI